MDNVVQAIFLAFAMFVLVIGLSASAYLLNSMNTAATAVIRANDKTSDYKTISYDSSELKRRNRIDAGGLKTRIVSADTVISTLYRYYKESFAIEIWDEDPQNGLNQLFDLTVETKINNSKGTEKFTKTYDADGNVKSVDMSNRGKLYDPITEAYIANYNSNLNKAYMWGAPWLGSAKDVEQRIDLYVSSKAGYIGNTFVDYRASSGNLKSRGFAHLRDKKFSEQFIQYTYSGDTYTETNGEDVETLVENQQELKKILIIYKVIN